MKQFKSHLFFKLNYMHITFNLKHIPVSQNNVAKIYQCYIPYVTHVFSVNLADWTLPHIDWMQLC